MRSIIDAHDTEFFGEEKQWRVPLNPNALQSDPGGLTVNRFYERGPFPAERTADRGGDYYILSLGLRATNLTNFANGRRVYHGDTATRAIHIEQPGTALRGIFRAPSEVIHVFVATKVMRHLLDEQEIAAAGGSPSLRSVYFEGDQTIERFLIELERQKDLRHHLDRIYTESLCVAVTAYLLKKYGNAPEIAPDTESRGLVSWRLKRVLEYIDAHFGESISLAQLAQIAGLSRMHFAAQFRKATGLRPHEAVLRKRIAYSRELLRSNDLSIDTVASAVGFQSRAHFSRVFKHFSGEAPSVWRDQNRR